MSHPVNLLNRELATNPARPFITFYDDASDERIDLSLKTFHNWAAKTANLLVDGLGTAPGDRVVLALPAHWQHAVWLFACWSAGLVPIPAPDAANAGTLPGFLKSKRPSGAEVLAVSADLLPAAAGIVSETVGLSLDAFGAPLKDCPPGVLDYAVEVRAYGDRFSAPIDEDADALDVADRTFSAAGLCALPVELPPATRLLTTASYSTAEEIATDLLAPLQAGGSIVLCRNLDEARLDRRIAQERVTRTASAA